MTSGLIALITTIIGAAVVSNLSLLVLDIWTERAASRETATPAVDLSETGHLGPLGVGTLVTVLEIVEFNVAHRGTTELHCILSAEATHVEHPAHLYFTERYAFLNRRLTKAFERMGQAGQLRAGVTAPSASRCTLALMDGLQVQWLLDPTSVDMVSEMKQYLGQLVTAQPWRSSPNASTATPKRGQRLRSPHARSESLCTPQANEPDADSRPPYSPW